MHIRETILNQLLIGIALAGSASCTSENDEHPAETQVNPISSDSTVSDSSQLGIPDSVPQDSVNMDCDFSADSLPTYQISPDYCPPCGMG